MLFHVELIRGGFVSRFHRALRDVGLRIRLDLRFALRDLSALESALPRDERREVLLELGAIRAKGALGARTREAKVRGRERHVRARAAKVHLGHMTIEGRLGDVRHVGVDGVFSGTSRKVEARGIIHSTLHPRPPPIVVIDALGAP